MWRAISWTRKGGLGHRHCSPMATWSTVTGTMTARSSICPRAALDNDERRRNNGGMERKIIFAVGEYYHLYNRGVEKRKTFMRHADSARFIRLLYLANGTEPYKYERLKEKALTEIDRGKAIVAIGAYVLMQNHFHLLAREI